MIAKFLKSLAHTLNKNSNMYDTSKREFYKFTSLQRPMYAQVY